MDTMASGTGARLVASSTRPVSTIAGLGWAGLGTGFGDRFTIGFCGVGVGAVLEPVLSWPHDAATNAISSRTKQSVRIQDPLLQAAERIVRSVVFKVNGIGSEPRSGAL